MLRDEASRKKGITVGELYERLGEPRSFRLRYSIANEIKESKIEQVPEQTEQAGVDVTQVILVWKFDYIPVVRYSIF